MKLAVLVSGTGSILEAIFEAGISVGVVVADRPCLAVEKANLMGLNSEIVLRDSFHSTFNRIGYTQKLTKVLEEAKIDLVAMSGFGTILESPIHNRYPGRILNTHPSLLPAFPGWDAVQDALSHGVKVTGCTIHQASLEVDAGPILAQKAVPVLPGDDVKSLHDRIKFEERHLYVEVIQQVISEYTVGTL